MVKFVWILVISISSACLGCAGMKQSVEVTNNYAVTTQQDNVSVTVKLERSW